MLMTRFLFVISAYACVQIAHAVTDFQQHFLTNTTPFQRLLSECQIADKSVLEIGVGTGALTRLILDANPYQLTGYEIDEAIDPKIVDTRFELIYADFLNLKQLCVHGQFFDDAAQEFAIIAAPPYNLLPYVKNFITTHAVQNVILMISPKYQYLFPSDEYIVAFTLSGAHDFVPPAKGDHHVIVKGFGL